MVLSKGFRKVTIQSNNLEAVRVLQESLMTDPGITVLRRIQRIFRTEGQWYSKHVSRDLNHAIDCLDKMSLVGKTCLQVFNGAPNEVVEFIQQVKSNDAFAQFILM